MERIKIVHDSGYLDIDIEAFFPCTLQKARKLFPLINRFCPFEDRAALMAELTELSEGYDGLCEMYKKRADELTHDQKERKRWLSEFRKTDKLRKRMRRNIDFLEVQR